MIAVSRGMYDALLVNAKRDDVDDLVLEEYRNIASELRAKNRLVLDLIRQELFLYEHRKLTGSPVEWSEGGIVWNAIRWGEVKAGFWGRPSNNLDAFWHKRLQLLLDAGETPLIGSEHLHEAARSLGNRFKWIQATIAAELAIKEVLCRLEPKLEVLLMNVPSPPIHKLYGEVLESVCGERSPYARQLQKGAEIRNKLVHAPKGIELEQQAVNDYITMVMEALEHLLESERNIRISSVGWRTRAPLLRVQHPQWQKKRYPSCCLSIIPSKAGGERLIRRDQLRGRRVPNKVLHDGLAPASLPPAGEHCVSGTPTGS
jgi:hypothetical protein